MKKFFSFVVLAVAALAMVSCNNNKLAEELTAAVNAKDAARTLAIADSINGLGDKADVGTQANATVAYLNAAGFMLAVLQDPAQADGIKGADAFTFEKLTQCIDNAEKFYNKTKDDETAKKAYATISSAIGGKTIEEFIAGARQFVQAKAAEVVEAEQAEQAEALDEAAAALDEAAAALEEVEE